MTIDKRQTFILAAVLAVSNLGQPTPKREDVQRMKHSEGTVTLGSAVMFFAEQYMETDEHQKMFMDEAKSFLKDMKDEKKARKAWSDVFKLYEDEPPRAKGTKAPAISKFNPRTPIDEASRDALEAEYMYYRTVLGKPKVESYKGNVPGLKAFVKSFALVAANKGDNNAKARVATSCPTKVAEGAYKDDRSAEAHTGHTKRGKLKRTAKAEARKARHVERVTKSEKTPQKQTSSKKDASATRTRDVPKDCFTLSDWAAAHKMEPKKARARARRVAKDIKKLEVAKYVFKNSSRKALDKIMEGK